MPTDYMWLRPKTKPNAPIAVIRPNHRQITEDGVFSRRSKSHEIQLRRPAGSRCRTFRCPEATTRYADREHRIAPPPADKEVVPKFRFGSEAWCSTARKPQGQKDQPRGHEDRHANSGTIEQRHARARIVRKVVIDVDRTRIDDAPDYVDAKIRQIHREACLVRRQRWIKHPANA